MRTKILIKVVLVIKLIPIVSYAQPGALDNSFGLAGKLITSLGSFGDEVNAVAIQSDNKIVYGGLTRSSFTFSDFALVRCNFNGTLDTTFGEGGKVITSIENRSKGNSIAIQSNGKILMGGSSDWYINLVRYNSDGTLDTAFGTDGKVITDISGYYSEKCKSVAIQSDGKILIGGYAQQNSNDLSHFILLRYNNDGTLDSTFGTGGIVIGSAGKGNSMAIQSDGKILLGGSSDFSFALLRYNADGTLDGTFGLGGEVITAVGSSGEAYSLSIQNDTKIVLGGYADASFALVRYNNDGTLDNSFGIGGKVIGNTGKGNSMHIQGDGKIVIGGSSSSSFVIMRFNIDGTIDNTFGIGGEVHTAAGIPCEGKSLCIQSDGKIILGGYDYNGSKTDMVLMRYDGDAVGIVENDHQQFGNRIYPNPFNSSTTIKFNMPLHNAELNIYNENGQKVMQIKNISGHHHTIYRNNLSSGLYFLRLMQENEILAQEKLLITD